VNAILSVIFNPAFRGEVLRVTGNYLIRTGASASPELLQALEIALIQVSLLAGRGSRSGSGSGREALTAVMEWLFAVLERDPRLADLMWFFVTALGDRFAGWVSFEYDFEYFRYIRT
jgi:hypothetical protein